MRAVSRLVLLVVWLAVSSIAAAEGNVVVYVDRNGDLVVIGDELGNRFTICSEAGCSRGAPDDAVWVYSLDGSGGPYTTVNGLPGYPGAWFVPTGTRMIVRANGGGDRIVCHPRYRDSLDLDTGAGHDMVTLEGQFGEVRVLGGPGDDSIGGAEGFETYGSFFADTGDGADGLFFGYGSLALASGSFHAKTGPGDDRIFFRDYIDCYGPLRIDMGSGADFLWCREGIRFLQSFALSTGADGDLVTLDGLSVSGWLDVHTGPGDDDLSLASSVMLGRTLFHGGSGSDELLDLGGNDFPGGPPKVLGFEAAPSWRARARR
jgi:hypothetical protein